MLELSTHILAEEEAKQRFLAVQLHGNPSGLCSCWMRWMVWGFSNRKLRE
jgi:hypothetical protein